MLDALRRGTSSFVAKALLGLLILSFAVWGIGDYVSGVARGSLATVGDQEISAQEFQRTYEDQMRLMAQYGTRLTPEQARLLGFDARVLNSLVSAAAIDQHASNLNLGISDETIAAEIARETAFTTSDGQFNMEAFRGFLQQIGMSEAQFLDAQRKDIVRRQLTATLTDGVVADTATVNALHAWQSEKRALSYFNIPEDAVTVAEPDEAKLKETYERTKSQYLVPETRKLAVLVLSLDAIKSAIKVTDAEIASYYELNRSSLDVPERRRVHRITFPDRAAADKALAEIKAGKGFLMVALETEGIGGTLPGLAARADFGEPAVAEAAFTLQANEVSDVITTSTGPAIIMVTEIAPGRKRSLEEVKDEVRQTIQEDRTNEELKAKHDAVDNERAALKPLKETAANQGLTYIEATTTRDNKTLDSQTAIENADGDALVARGFEGSVGLESETVDLGDGGIGWVDVLEVIPASEKAFADVKDEVRAAYMEAERAKALNERAAKLLERIGQGATLDEVAADVKGKVETAEPVDRSTVPQGLSQNAIQVAFATAKGSAAAAESANRRSRVIVKVNDILPAGAPTEEEARQLREALQSQLQSEAVAEYAAALRDSFGVNINEALFRQLVGADS